MALRVKEVAQLVGNEIILKDPEDGSFAALLTSIEAIADADGPTWEFSIVVGADTPPGSRRVRVLLERFLRNADYEKSLHEPIHFTSGDATHFVLFKGRFFVPERNPKDDREREEILLRVKKAVYRDEEELNSLKSYVSNIEAATAYRRNGPQRFPISDDVKLVVWTRDGGACVRCGSKEKIHFDHIIPVAKGGSAAAINIQILCETCNLKKLDNIAF